MLWFKGSFSTVNLVYHNRSFTKLIFSVTCQINLQCYESPLMSDKIYITHRDVPLNVLQELSVKRKKQTALWW